MASLAQYHEQLTTHLGQMAAPDRPEPAAFLAGYHTALEDLRLTWVTSTIWQAEMTLSDLPTHVARIIEALEARVGAMVPAGAAQEGGGP